MNAPPLTLGLRGVLRYSRWDALPVSLAAAHGLLLLWVPAAPVIALGLWWNSNTVSHHFLHTPFFRSPTLNRLFSCYLSVLLGIPQALWRQQSISGSFDELLITDLAVEADVEVRSHEDKPLQG